MLRPINGVITVCIYCGEQTGNSQKYCATCRSQKGRKVIFDENVKICQENQAKGFITPKALPSWK
jgi:hypothetical protein